MFASAVLVSKLLDFVQQAILVVTGIVAPKTALLPGGLGHHGSDDLGIDLDTCRNIEMEATKEQCKPSTNTYSAYHVEHIARPGLAITVARVGGNGLEEIVQNQQRCQSLQASSVLR